MLPSQPCFSLLGSGKSSRVEVCLRYGLGGLLPDGFIHTGTDDRTESHFIFISLHRSSVCLRLSHCMPVFHFLPACPSMAQPRLFRVSEQGRPAPDWLDRRPCASASLFRLVCLCSLPPCLLPKRDGKTCAQHRLDKLYFQVEVCLCEPRLVRGEIDPSRRDVGTGYAHLRKGLCSITSSSASTLLFS